MDNLLSVRLQSVFDMIPPDAPKKRFIDVGSDHGHLTCYALTIGGFNNSVSTDIHKDPAAKTQEFLVENNLGDRSEVYCTDGLNGIDLLPDDVVVMAGLGGNNIIDIMGRALEVTDAQVLKTIKWCLQPQKSHETLREFLYANGFNIINEDVCLDREIYYSYMLAVYDGVKRSLNSYEKFYGPVLVKKYESGDCSEVQREYFDLLDGRYNIRARGDKEVEEMLINLNKRR